MAPHETPPVNPGGEILNSATLIMGLTGTGKSSLLATAMEWVWETFKVPTFYYLFDGGGFPTTVQALINRGIVRVWRVRSRAAEGLAPESIHRAAQGWWPSKIDPRTGIADPGVRLVPPVTTVYQMYCPEGHLMKSSPSSQALTPGPCNQCKPSRMVDLANRRIERVTQRTRGFPERRAVMYDGISSANSWLLEDLSLRTLGGEESRLGGKVLSGDMIFGENNRAQIGFTQNKSEGWALASSGIPNLVIPAIWTALVQEGSDEGGLTVVGPLLAGQAKTAVAPQWFGNTIEALVEERGPKRFRQLRFTQWIDKQNRRHLCRVGAAPGAFEPFWEEDETEEGAVPFRIFNLGLFHQRLIDSRLKTEDEYAKRYPGAPGISAAESEFGEAPVGASAVVPPSVAAPAQAGPRPAAAAPAPVPQAPRPVAQPPVKPAQPAPAQPPRVAGMPAGPGPVRPPAPTAAPAAAQPPAPRPAAPPVAAQPAAAPAAAPGTPSPKGPARGPAPPPGRRPS